ncbi:MAG: cyclic nucleotide-binding domain-containing protein [Spirochaetaceae bacterium]|jgi:CRP-like cAMP-binding protein|nr:cyclic nucleotide-binding domain-containing protein [Spirochaetaceae bacterium]
MAPKSVKYSPNSIIYFKGDSSNAIYVLKKGKVGLNYKDLQTGQEVQDLIQMGEFFGVKAALGHYTHDETAVVLQDSEVIQFSVGEFESMLKGNNRLVLKMMKVFSTQLRRIHRQVQGLLSSDLAGNPELGLFEIGQYYRRHKDYQKAISAFNRYKVLYPRGYYAAQVEEALQSVDQGTFYKSNSNSEPQSQNDQVSVFICSKYIERGNYQEALRGLTSYMKNSVNQDDRSEAEYQLGLCLTKMEKPQEAIKQFTSLVKRFPKHPKLGQILYYLAFNYEKLGDKTKAVGFLKKAMPLLAGDSLSQKAANLLSELEGGI